MLALFALPALLITPLSMPAGLPSVYSPKNASKNACLRDGLGFGDHKDGYLASTHHRRQSFDPVILRVDFVTCSKEPCNSDACCHARSRSLHIPQGRRSNVLLDPFRHGLFLLQ